MEGISMLICSYFFIYQRVMRCYVCCRFVCIQKQGYTCMKCSPVIMTVNRLF